MFLSIEIVSTHSLFYFLFCILFAVGGTYFLYGKHPKTNELAPWAIRSMAFLRFCSLFILSALLLGLYIKSGSRQIEKPIIVFATDNSLSMLNDSDSLRKSEEITSIQEKLKNELGDQFSFEYYRFGESAIADHQLNFRDRSTNYSDLLYTIENNYLNRNLSALVILSDGLYNYGLNPLYSGTKQSPIYTVGLGDTTEKKDLILENVNFNKIAYLGNDFPVELIIDAKKCRNEKTEVLVYRKEKLVQQATIHLGASGIYLQHQLVLNAAEVGIQTYTVRLNPLEGEYSELNNSKEITVEVIDSKQKVLILSESPHPDVKAIKSVIDENENYEVDVALVKAFKGQLQAYNLVIFNQISSSNSALTLVNELQKKSISALFILGAKSRINVFNQFQLGFTIEGNRNRLNEVYLSVNDQFPLFTYSDQFAQIAGQIPPFISPFGIYELSKSYHILAYQRIGNVKTLQPLMAFGKYGETKYGFICGEGLWRWKLSEYAFSGKQEVYREIIDKMVQYLSVKEDKSLFRLQAKNSFLENEMVHFEAELYNESYELINKPDIAMEIKDAEGKNYEFNFSRTTKAYTLNAGNLPVGQYTYTARVKTGGDELIREGYFMVEEIMLERMNSVADHQLLTQLSEQSGGVFTVQDQLNKITDHIHSRGDLTAVSYYHQLLKDIIEYKWIFIMLLLTLTAEWLLRKRNGL